MSRAARWTGWLAVPAGVLGLALMAAGQNQKTTVPPCKPVTIIVKPAEPTPPPVSLTLGPRHGHVTPKRHGCTHAGGGNTDVAQPSPDKLVVTMKGAVVAYPTWAESFASLHFELEQCLEVNFDDPKLKKAKVTLEGRVIGLLRSHCKGDSASYDMACAGIGCDTTPILTLCVPPHAAADGQNLSVNDHDGPLSVPIVPGKYDYRQVFTVSAVARQAVLPCKGPSAEFGPEQAIDPLWISYKEPFHGADKKDFGFQVTLTVAEDKDTAADNGKEKGDGENLPPPKADR
jgi:hypothetical protein